MDGFINDIITIMVDDEHWIDCSKKCGSIGHTYTIPTTTAIRTPETRQSTLLKETGGRGRTSRAQEMPRVGHKHSLSEGITT